MTFPLRVTFVFASVGIGGAERSMLRLMQAAHPHTLNCQVIFTGKDNPDFMEALQTACIPFHQLEWFDVWRLARCFRDFRTDIAYLFGQIRSLGWTLAARLAGVPVVIGADRSTLDRFTDIFGRKLDRFVIDQYISNSQKAADDLIHRVGISSGRVHVVYNGLISPEERPTPVAENQELGTPTIICVANIQKRKGQVYLLQAVQKLRPYFPSIRALLVGKDLSDGELFRQFDAAGLRDCYTWTGFTPNVRGYLARASIFVLPSLYFEGVPTSILEAMMEGVPVIATNISGVSELVIDGETGLLVPPGDADALTEKLHMLLTSTDLQQQLCQRARNHVEQYHSMQTMVDGHMNVFRQVLATKGKA